MKKVKSRIGRSLVLAMCMIIAVTFMPWFSGAYEAEAASSPMKTYNKILKKGNNIYCIVDTTMTSSLYKVNIKTGKVKRLIKYDFGEGGEAGNMHLHKGFIYYTITDDMSATLYRVRTTGKGGKALAKLALSCKYQIKGSKIYYSAWSDSETGITKGTPKVMSLSGKNKKKASAARISMKSKSSNAKGYSLKKVYDHKEVSQDGDIKKYYKYYLVKPSGSKIYMMTDYIWDFS